MNATSHKASVSLKRDVIQANKAQLKAMEDLIRTQAEARDELLEVVRVKKEKVEELDDASDLNQQQLNFTCKLQAKIAELAKLALKSGASPKEVNRIMIKSMET